MIQHLRLLLLGMSLVLAAPGALAQDALARDMLRRLQQAYPHHEVRSEPNDQIGLYEKGVRTFMLDLGNLRVLCETRADDCDRQKTIRVALAKSPGDSKFDLGVVRSVVRPADYLVTVRRQLEQMKAGRTPEEVEKINGSMPLSLPLGRHFVRMWVRDSANGMAPLGQAELRELGLGPADLDAASAVNFDREAMPTLVQSSRLPAVWTAEGSDYLPSVLVDAKLWRRVFGKMAAEEASVCIPERDALLAYFPRLDPGRQVDFVKLCQHLAARGVTFFGQPIRRINDNWEVR